MKHSQDGSSRWLRSGKMENRPRKVEVSTMATIIRAVYLKGVLCPTQPLALREGETVELSIMPTDLSADSTVLPNGENEFARRIRSCRTFSEWLEVTKSLPADDGGYDIVQALDENRRWSGEQPLLSKGTAQ